MVEFTQFMSVGLEKCGSDERTFSRLVDVWNAEKEEIRQMSKREVRENLDCP